jgi:hypothetical protein
VIQVLSDCDHPLTVITKSALVERDVDLLAPMARRGLAAVYVTITTLDPALSRIWEPRAAAPWRRLELIRRLSEAGIPVGVSIAPLVPFINEQELERIMTEARAAGAGSAFYVMLRLPWELKELFSDWLHVHFPDRARRVLSRLGDLRGGPDVNRLNDARFFTRMKGQGKWAELVRMRFEVASRRLGFGRERVMLRTDLFRPPGQGGQLGCFPPPPSGRNAKINAAQACRGVSMTTLFLMPAYRAAVHDLCTIGGQAAASTASEPLSMAGRNLDSMPSARICSVSQGGTVVFGDQPSQAPPACSVRIPPPRPRTPSRSRNTEYCANVPKLARHRSASAIWPAD